MNLAHCWIHPCFVAGANNPDAASESNIAYPSPCVSESLLLFFTINSTCARSPGMVSGVLADKGGSVIFFALHSRFTFFEPSEKCSVLLSTAPTAPEVAF